MSLVRCPECYSENGLGDETCSNCGAPLPAEEFRSADTDWLSDLSEMIASAQSQEDDTLAPEGLPDWLEADHPEREGTTVDEGDDLLAWLHDIRPMGVADADVGRADEDLPEWLDRATGSLRTDTPTLPGEGFEEMQESASEPGPTEGETRATAEEPEEPLPAWVSELTSSEEWPETADDAAVVDWFAHQEEDEAKIEPPSPELPMTRPLNPTKELRGVPQQIASESLPDWLNDQIGEVPEDSGIAAETVDHGDDVLRTADFEHAERFRFDEEGEQEPDAMQVHDADIPEWLLALKPGASSEAAGPENALPVESSGPLAGLRGVIPVAPVIAANAQALRAAPYEESKEQQRQIALLQQLTSVGSDLDDRVGEQSPGSTFTVVRILLGSALLVFAILGWLLPSLGVALPLPAPAEVPEAAREAYTTLNNASGQTALVAFEYTPALAGELDAVAGTMLRHLADNGSPIITVSQSAAGSAVAERIAAETEGLESYSLGFVPGEAIGLRQLADCLEDSGSCQMLSSSSANGAVQAGLEDVSLIVVLAGERDGLSNWIEQIGTQSDSAMVAGVAQQLGPVAAPYQASEQLSGYLNGLPAAAAYEQRLRGNEEYAAEWLTSLTLVHWLVIAVLAAGSLYFGLMGLATTRMRKTGM